ncbi:neutral/alkaline non-lysosomal ceramidase N-terminal domain-containing protein [Paenibacillus sp. J2TS4]|uniref:neutral/alkaline non-lysosomal ceramidase N-terminal domain-containing protein n=1 Tax=Paenibacillus sp. J2TS4 TaxID=2807194 RepID=UPI001B108D13|nr:neutral/alkaline non-lysosomal ceramidase N-terminal domain-containing protein [Paenibacillus sp. J2TS4]GIP34966.1 hypothetical protein J2TS4_41760 [Paenibacillus sp. J2TS4]
MNTTLLLGTAKMDITPASPIPLAGFASRKNKGAFQGISHPLYAKVLLFQSRDDDGRAFSALLVSADLLWWGSDVTAALKLKLSERFGLPGDAIILHGTHTHSGPQTSERFAPLLGVMDKGYIEFLEQKLMDGVSQALTRLEPVVIERGQAEHRLNINRRKRKGDKIVIAPNESGPNDPELTVIRFCNADDEVKALWVHYACHPTITSDNLISPEFPGVAMEQLEQASGGQTVAVYLQGCCGDVGPNLIRDGNFYFGSDRDVCSFAAKLAEAVLSVTEQPMKPLSPLPLQVRSETLPLPLSKLPSRSELNKLKSREEIIGQWSRMLLDNPERLAPELPLELTYVQLAKGLSLLAMNAEIVVEYGLFVKKTSSSGTLPIAYSNGMIGYVPTAQQIDEGGYEADESTKYFGMAAPFDPSVEPCMLDGIVRFMNGSEAANVNRTAP